MNHPVSSLQSFAREKLADIYAQGLLRRHRTVDGPQGPLLTVNGRDMLNFCSNDYLGLAGHPALKEAMKKGIDRYGVGAGASRLMCGHTSAHARLEERLAQFTQRDRALVFSTGYMANLALVNVFSRKSGVIIGDRLNHASLIDAALLAGAKLRRYQHADTRSLREALEKTGAGNCRLVVTETVFSMDGDIAPLPEMAGICREAQVALLVDDAHGFGVLGKNGGGALEHFGLDMQEVPLMMATFGKALGAFGAFVAGEADLIECLVQSGRTYIYTTALPPALAETACCALDLVERERWRVVHLQQLVERFRMGALRQGLRIADSITPIQPLLVGNSRRATELSEALFAQGIFVAAIRPPTVPKNTARLRISLTAAHTEGQIDQLLSVLSDLIQANHVHKPS
ncbi:MAG: 8-amino-7-oxononanoate synthase [Gammaproteobacteria bacterium]